MEEPKETTQVTIRQWESTLLGCKHCRFAASQNQEDKYTWALACTHTHAHRHKHEYNRSNRPGENVHILLPCSQSVHTGVNAEPSRRVWEGTYGQLLHIVHECLYIFFCSISRLFQYRFPKCITERLSARPMKVNEGRGGEMIGLNQLWSVKHN